MAVAYYFIGIDGNSIHFSTLSHTISLVTFFGLLLLATKQSPPGFINATSLKSSARGNAALWLGHSIPLGFLIRFGSEGIVLIFMYFYSPGLALEEFESLTSRHGETLGGIGILVILMVIVGALDEEFIYRKVGLWHFCWRYGVCKGIVVVSLIFGAVHLNPVAALAAFCLGAAYIVSGRLWVAVIAHAAGNVFHPLFHPLVRTSDWNTYFLLSAISAFVLAAVIAFFLATVRSRRFTLYGN